MAVFVTKINHLNSNHKANIKYFLELANKMCKYFANIIFKYGTSYASLLTSCSVRSNASRFPSWKRRCLSNTILDITEEVSRLNSYWVSINFFSSSMAVFILSIKSFLVILEELWPKLEKTQELFF